MINKKLKEERGITLITLALAIVIMMIISSVLVYNARIGVTTRILNNMYNDVRTLKDKVDIYYAKYGTIPIIDTLYTKTSHIKDINPNDNENYYVVDLEQLENLSLNYGQDYQNYKSTPSSTYEDIYIINEKSHNIYYVQGIDLDGKNYYTTLGDYTKVNT